MWESGRRDGCCKVGTYIYYLIINTLYIYLINYYIYIYEIGYGFGVGTPIPVPELNPLTFQNPRTKPELEPNLPLHTRPRRVGYPNPRIFLPSLVHSAYITIGRSLCSDRPGLAA